MKKITLTIEQLKSILHAATGNVRDFVMHEDEFINEWISTNVSAKSKVLILKADKNSLVNCPFCNQQHKHGKGGGNGHRIAHCAEPVRNEFITIGNKVYYKRDGYHVEFQ